MNNTKFSDYHFCDELSASLDRLGFVQPTPIQEKAIPLALEGKDVLGSAQTGTGKTLAFVLPILEKFLKTPNCKDTALILAPTRELASQILKSIHDLLPKKSYLKTALLIGGDPIGKQFGALRLKPQFIVGTPGRINDHLNRRSLDLHQTRFLVLDEADRMMDMGFEPQIHEIIKLLPEDRQTFMFSATLSSHIVKLSQKYLQQPERVAIGDQHKVLNIQQEAIQVKHAQKFATLVKELDKREGSIIVFVKTKHGADELADKLSEHEHSVNAIHGDLHQRKREKVIYAFRNKRHRILVATDVAARGLDIPHIEHVINYDLPQTPEDYMHRIGRTARAGKKGEAISFVSPSESGKWKDIQRFMQQSQNPASSERRENYSQKPHRREDHRKKTYGKPHQADQKRRENKFEKSKDDKWEKKFKKPFDKQRDHRENESKKYKPKPSQSTTRHENRRKTEYTNQYKSTETSSKRNRNFKDESYGSDSKRSYDKKKKFTDEFKPKFKPSFKRKEEGEEKFEGKHKKHFQQKSKHASHFKLSDRQHRKNKE